LGGEDVESFVERITGHDFNGLFFPLRDLPQSFVPSVGNLEGLQLFGFRHVSAFTRIVLIRQFIFYNFPRFSTRQPFQTAQCFRRMKKKPTEKKLLASVKRTLRVAAKLPVTEVHYSVRAELRKLADLIDSKHFISLACIIDLSAFKRGIEENETGFKVSRVKIKTSKK
jgi:hypothetical protein